MSCSSTGAAAASTTTTGVVYGRDKLDGKFKDRCNGPRLIPPFSCADSRGALPGLHARAHYWLISGAPCAHAVRLMWPV